MQKGDFRYCKHEADCVEDIYTEMEITKNKNPLLGSRFSIDFFIHTLVYGFLLVTNIWQKSRDYWFADFFLVILKIHWLVWIFWLF
jgi:hypothetical protein